jgi:hypothetical protein
MNAKLESAVYGRDRVMSGLKQCSCSISTHTLPRHSLLSKRRPISRYTPKCNFTEVYMDSTACPAPNLTKLTNAQEVYVPISYTGYHPNRSPSMESKGANTFTPLRTISLPIFTQLTSSRQHL